MVKYFLHFTHLCYNTSMNYKIVFIVLLPLLLWLILHEKKFDQKELLIAASLPKTSVMSELGESVVEGVKAYFNYANNEKLLGDQTLRFITLDDKYEPHLTRKNLEHFLTKENIFSFFAFVGTPTVKNILPIFNKEEIPFFAPFTGASFLRIQNNKHIINFRSSYKQEIEAHINYLHEQNCSRFAIFYQNDEYGKDVYLSSIKLLKKHHLSLVAEGSYKRNTLSIRHAYYEIKKSKPDAIIMIGAYKVNTLFINKAKEDKVFEKSYFSNISFGNATAMVKALNKDTSKILFSQVVPSYQNRALPIVQEYHKVLREYNSSYEANFISFEAFLAAKTLVLAIQKAKKPLTHQGFLKALKSLPSDSLEGLTLKYQSTQLLNHVYLFSYEDQHFTKINP